MTSFRQSGIGQFMGGFAGAIPTAMTNIIQLQNVLATREATQQQREFQNSFQILQQNETISQHNAGILKDIAILKNKGDEVSLARANEMQKMLRPLLKTPQADLTSSDLPGADKHDGPGFFSKLKSVGQAIIPGGSDGAIAPPEELNNIPSAITPPTTNTTPDTSITPSAPVDPIADATSKLTDRRLKIIDSGKFPIAKINRGKAEALARDPNVSDTDFIKSLDSYAPKTLPDAQNQIFALRVKQREVAKQIFDIVKSDKGASLGNAPGIANWKVPFTDGRVSLRNLGGDATGKNDLANQNRSVLNALASELESAESQILHIGGAITEPEIKIKLAALPTDLHMNPKEYLNRLYQFDKEKATDLNREVSAYETQGFNVDGVTKLDESNTLSGIVDSFRMNKQGKIVPAASGTPAPTATPTQELDPNAVTLESASPEATSTPVPGSAEDVKNLPPMPRAGNQPSPTITPEPLRQDETGDLNTSPVLKGTITNPNIVSPNEAANMPTGEIMNLADRGMQSADQALAQSEELGDVVNEQKDIHGQTIDLLDRTSANVDALTGNSGTPAIDTTSRNFQSALYMVKTKDPEFIKSRLPYMKPQARELVLQAIQYLKAQGGSQ